MGAGGREVAEQSVAELTTAMERWDEDMAGVSVPMGSRSPVPGEVTRLSGGEINVLLAPVPSSARRTTQPVNYSARRRPPGSGHPVEIQEVAQSTGLS